MQNKSDGLSATKSLRKYVNLGACSVNEVTLAGTSADIVKMLESRSVDICCL